MNQDSQRTDQKRGTGLRGVHYVAPLLVAITAFAFLGWSSGASSLFSSLDAFSPDVKNPIEDIQGGNSRIARSPVGAVLSHWEYTSHCSMTGQPGCPVGCGGNGNGGQCTSTVLGGCCTGDDTGDGCGMDGFGGTCSDCCTGVGTFNTYP